MTGTRGITAAACAAAAFALLAGCGSEDDTGSAAGGGTEQAGETGETAATEWQEPADYQYTLESSCGERNGLGLFAVSVAGGEVVEVTARDASAELQVEGDGWRSVPTIGDLLREAAQAEAAGAEVVDVSYAEDGAGPPSAIDIDYSTAAVDDEICYVISDFAPVA